MDESYAAWCNLLYTLTTLTTINASNGPFGHHFPVAGKLWVGMLKGLGNAT